MESFFEDQNITLLVRFCNYSLTQPCEDWGCFGLRSGTVCQITYIVRDGLFNFSDGIDPVRYLASRDGR